MFGKSSSFAELNTQQQKRCSSQTKYIYLSTVLKYILSICTFFLETFYFNFTTFERQISYFLLHYNSGKVIE